jgi:DNA polymerase-4
VLSTKENYRWDNPIRSLGVRGSDLVTADKHMQLDLFDNSNLDAEILATTIDNLHKRFGHYSVNVALCCLIDSLPDLVPKMII